VIKFYLICSVPDGVFFAHRRCGSRWHSEIYEVKQPLG
jgi:hypothetical protein